MLDFFLSFFLSQAAPVLITLNPEDEARKEKFSTGRCLVLNCEHAPYTVSNGGAY
jgi:hypothetical protein